MGEPHRYNPDPRIVAGGKIGGAIRRHGADSPQVAAARTEARVASAEKVLRDLYNSAPAPTPAQTDLLRRLLPPVAA